MVSKSVEARLQRQVAGLSRNFGEVGSAIGNLAANGLDWDSSTARDGSSIRRNVRDAAEVWSDVSRLIILAVLPWRGRAS